MSTINPIMDITSFFQNTLISNIKGSIQHRRVPFTFTSTARLVRGGDIKYAQDRKFIIASGVNRTRTQLALIERDARGTAALSQLGLGAFVGAFDVRGELTGKSGGGAAKLGISDSVIRMAVNPESMQFTQGKRISRRDTMEGSTFYHFTNSADQNNDILEVSFSGQTGNINTRVSPLDLIATGAVDKLRRWHDLMNLTREGMLLNEANTGVANMAAGIPNQFFITYRTLLFPMQITLVGFFSKVLDFTESAASPNSTNYSMSFTVTDTYPKLEDLSAQLASSVLISSAIDAARAPVSALADLSVSALDNSNR